MYLWIPEDYPYFANEKNKQSLQSLRVSFMAFSCLYILDIPMSFFSSLSRHPTILNDECIS